MRVQLLHPRVARSVFAKKFPCDTNREWQDGCDSVFLCEGWRGVARHPCEISKIVGICCGIVCATLCSATGGGHSDGGTLSGLFNGPHNHRLNAFLSEIIFASGPRLCDRECDWEALSRPISLAHQNRSDFCDLRLRCPSRTPEIASDFRDKTKQCCIAI